MLPSKCYDETGGYVVSDLSAERFYAYVFF